MKEKNKVLVHRPAFLERMQCSADLLMRLSVYTAITGLMVKEGIRKNNNRRIQFKPAWPKRLVSLNVLSNQLIGDPSNSYPDGHTVSPKQRQPSQLAAVNHQQHSMFSVHRQRSLSLAAQLNNGHRSHITKDTLYASTKKLIQVVA